MALKDLIVKQNPEAEMPTEVLAEHIAAIAEGVRQLRNGRLNDRALILLIRHAVTPTISAQAVKDVLTGIENLEAAYLRKPSSAKSG